MPRGRKPSAENDGLHHKRESDPEPGQLLLHLPEAPADFTDGMKAKWVDICTTLLDRKMLSKHWLIYVIEVVRVFNTLWLYQGRVTSDGLTYQNSHGSICTHPLVGECTKLRNLLRHMLNDLGLSPSGAKSANVMTTPQLSPGAGGVPTRNRGDAPFVD